MADIDKTPDTILPKTAQKLLLTTKQLQQMMA
jgi:hypothetical protein